ncbi:NADP-dependent oxidoreductase [Actinoplanes bogorensis]|uniref:NADP-dependent oxidoreductase n=1 Tax=Paractinoplanes bogorensis TaxID=1610840 RepID=A0ABS5YX32_9ACTN|nr:NADP-dependent oxidoreductase [Actinoplanes bogorensis]MBU2667293.1 NADP-dependent oxidoreductase [Actinoplanes bogorensis]
MRAITQQTFGGPSVLQLASVPRPTPLPTEVLVRVHAAGVNPVDWKTREGSGMADVLGEPPFILGWDVAGVVEELGWGVSTLAVGDKVYGMPWFPRAAGAYSEYVTAPARQFARAPHSIPLEQAAAVPLAALTAWQALIDTARITAGQRVLVTAAAGGVGHFAVQFARLRGAHVIATASERNHEWLAALGASSVIDYNRSRFEEQVSDVDVVIDLAGSGLESLSTLRPGGLLVAVPSGVSPELQAAADSAGKRVTAFLVEPDGPALTRIAEHIDAGEVRVEVDQVLPLEDAAKAHDLVAAGHTRGKVVLRIV